MEFGDRGRSLILNLLFPFPYLLVIFFAQRDMIGIGGSWSEFIDYVIVSIKSDDVKLILEGQSKLEGILYFMLIIFLQSL